MRTIQAAIYARVSTKPQAGEDKVSIPDQIRECRKFIQRENWECAGEFVDPGVSANTAERPGLKDLLNNINTFDVVVAWDFDRFYRDRRSVAGYILDTLDEHGKQITSLKQPIPVYDPDHYDPRENDTPYMLREMAGFTSGIDNRRRFRTLQKGLKERFNQGFMLQPPPYGYKITFDLVDGKLVRLPRSIVPEEAAVVRRIFAEYCDGKSYFAIARDLNRDKLASRRKPYWSANVVRGIIRNPVYCGHVHRCTTSVRGKRKVLPEEQWVTRAGRHEPIVSQDVWDAAQAARKRRQRHSRAVGCAFILSGILTCGYCGFGMCKDGSWGGGYYICGNYKTTHNCQRNGYRRTTLEKEVAAFVFRLLREQDLFSVVQEKQWNATLAGARLEMERAQNVIAGFPSRRNRLLGLFEGGDINREEFLERRDEHTRAEHEARALFAEKQALVERLSATRVSRALYENALCDLETSWETCDAAKKKLKLAALIERIVIKDHAFDVQLKMSGTA